MPLTFEEINSVDCIDELRALYEEKRGSFRSEREFLRFLKNDWRRICNNYNRDSEEQAKFKLLEVIIDRVFYNIYGISVDPTLGKEYRKIISNTVKPGQNWLLEQNLGLYLQLPEKAIEIPDNLVASRSHLCKKGLSDFLLDSCSLPFYVPFYVADSITGENIFALNRTEALERLSLHPEKFTTPLPSYVKIELNEKQDPVKYTPDQARSAYQAEFMRAWKEREDKNILVELSHAPQIQYFLRKGVKDQKIVDAAQSQAELLEQDAEKFSELVKKSRLRSKRYNCAGDYLGMAGIVAAF